MELSPYLDESAPVPLYLQLYRYLREEIHAGRIPQAARLPSVRALSKSLGVSKTTVEWAYQQLLAEGYIVSRPRSGYFAARLEGDFASTLGGDSTAAGFGEIRSGGRSDGLLQLDRGMRSGGDDTAPASGTEGRIDFHPSRVDEARFPFGTWRKISQQTFLEAGRNGIGYGDPQGEPELRAQLALYLARARGVRCNPEQIVVAAGTQTALSLLCHLLGREGRVMAMEQPGYHGARVVVERFGWPVRDIPVHHDGLNLEALEASGANVVYVTPSHQYPTGAVMPIGKRLKLLSWAAATGGIIVEDDYDGEFRYRGRPIPALQGLAGGERVVYLGTLSKTLLPAIRLCYLVLPNGLAERYRREFRPHWEQTASRLHQLTLQRFMEQGDWERHIRRMRVLYQKKHAALLEAIQCWMGEYVRVRGQDAGLHVVVEVNSSRSGSELAGLAESGGVKVYPIGDEPVFMVGFGGLDIGEIQAGIARLHQAWSPHRRGRRVGRTE